MRLRWWELKRMRTSLRTMVVATRNAGKTREFARLLEPLGLTVRSLSDYSGAPDIVEDGDTFADNALKKARTIAEAFGLPVLADDSGLCVDVLDGRPGVYSARYAGEDATDEANNAKLLAELNALAASGAIAPETATVSGTAVRLMSRAKFVCALALYEPGNDPTIVEGFCAGWIVDRPLGDGGFGYDPLFYVPEQGLTMAQLSPDRKNEISHRAAALRQLKQRLLG